jgi:hypothetical protein
MKLNVLVLLTYQKLLGIPVLSVLAVEFSQPKTYGCIHFSDFKT